MGFLLVDSLKKLLYINDEARYVLSYPHSPLEIKSLDEHFSQKIELLLPDAPISPPEKLMFGRRCYLNRVLTVVYNAKDPVDSSTAILLERRKRTIDDDYVSELYGLSPREYETVGHLVQGFTSKEIAQRMNISPYTVKTYIRLIMVKVGVSTRSGIVGKLVRASV